MSTSLQLKDIPEGGYKVTVTSADGTEIFYHEIKHPLQITLSTIANPVSPATHSIPPTTFPKFSRLPAQIRDRIWNFALDQPRIFSGIDKAPRFIIELLDMPYIEFAHKPPAVRQVCRESRHVSDKRGTYLFGSRTSMSRSLWFDFQSDILFDTGYVHELGRLPDASNIQNVALWHDVAQDLINPQRLSDFITEYSHCRKLIFVFGVPYKGRAGEIEFLRVRDNDHVTSKETWGKKKNTINEKWCKKSFLRQHGLKWKPFPVIEAVEFVLVKDKKQEKLY